MQLDPSLNADVQPVSGARRVLELIESRRALFADLWFVDLSGRPWKITIAARDLKESAIAEGIPLDGQPVGGDWNGVMLLRPDPDAAFFDSVASQPTVALICDLLDTRTGAPIATDTRAVLRRAELELLKRGVSRMTIGIEPEFFVLSPDGKAAPEDAVWDLLRSAAVLLGEAGMRIDWFRTGPANGQARLQMHPGPVLRMADQVMVYRHVLSNLARRRGLVASFLPKPVSGPAAAAMPTHHALWDGEKNLFHDDAGWALSSELCRWYAGGLLRHASALLAFCGPTTNSYRALAARHRGAMDLMLSSTRKSAICRIPARNPSPGARRIKCWLADSTANPYLAVASMILAGIDGIDRRLKAPTDADFPLDGARLPHSLEESLEALQKDRAFLVSCGAFSDGLIDRWVQERWERFVVPVRSEPHPVELKLAQVGAVDMYAGPQRA